MLVVYEVIVHKKKKEIKSNQSVKDEYSFPKSGVIVLVYSNLPVGFMDFNKSVTG